MNVILSNVSGVISLAPDAMDRQRSVLAITGAITAIESAEQQAAAVLAIQNAREIVGAVEEVGTNLRRPIRAYADEIMTKEKEFNGPIKADIERLRTLIGEFQQREVVRVAQEEAARHAEITRLQHVQNLLEQQQIAAVTSGPTNDDAANISLALASQAEDAAVETLAVAMSPRPVAATATGLSVKAVWQWAFTDKAAAYMAHPEFFELTEKKLVIRQVVSDGFECPGMRVWKVSNPVIRKKQE